MILLKNILVADDFGPASSQALNYGRAFARTFGATLHVLHLIENLFLKPTAVDPHDIKAARARSLRDRLTQDDHEALHARAVVETSDAPAEAIAAYARTNAIDLIVMGTNGRSAMAQILMGSVAERVVRTAPCPVLTVRHPEHDFVMPDLEPQATARA